MMRRLRRAAAAVLATGLLASCTIDDRFLLAEPEPEVTLEEIEAVASPGGDTPCRLGTTVYWGRARNTGEVFLYDVTVLLDVFDAAGGLLGRFAAEVYNGEAGSDAFGNTSPDSTLDIDQQGHFLVCTTVPFGVAGRAEARFEFVTFEVEE